MQFVTDAFSLTGASHIPKGLGCQDYGTAGLLPGGAYCILCDGSSCADPKTGEPDRSAKTAVGASGLALLTAKAIRDEWRVNPTATCESSHVVTSLRGHLLPQLRELQGLSNKDMSSTCMFSVVSQEGGYVCAQGDGVLAYRYTSGDIRVVRWDWKGNAPFYPVYTHSGLELFVQNAGGWDCEALSEQTWLIPSGTGNPEPELLEKRLLTVQQGVRGIYLPITGDELQTIDTIALFSDGIATVAKVPSLAPEFRDWKEMVRRMFMRFGQPLPNFAQARLARWEDRDTKAMDACHFDDLTLSAIRVKHEQSS